MNQQQIIEFFETHPNTEVVYEALGTLFLEPEKADEFVCGTSAKVETHYRPGAEPAGDEEEEEVEQPVIEEPVIESPVIAEPETPLPDAMTYGNDASIAEKVQATKKAAAKAPAKKKAAGKK